MALLMVSLWIVKVIKFVIRSIKLKRPACVYFCITWLCNFCRTNPLCHEDMNMVPLHDLIGEIKVPLMSVVINLSTKSPILLIVIKHFFDMKQHKKAVEVISRFTKN